MGAVTEAMLDLAGVYRLLFDVATGAASKGCVALDPLRVLCAT